MAEHTGCSTLRLRRREVGLTQAQLAEQTGVSRQTIIAIERGSYAPSVYLALKLAAVLGSRVDSIFVLKENNA